jgi:hypothetical protein
VKWKQVLSLAIEDKWEREGGSERETTELGISFEQLMERERERNITIKIQRLNTFYNVGLNLNPSYAKHKLGRRFQSALWGLLIWALLALVRMNFQGS